MLKELLPDISHQYIKNKSGKVIGVFIDIKDYKLICETIEDVYLGALALEAKASGGERKSLEKVEQELKDIHS